jgi:tungstate transport system substrate-binding protein
MAHCLRSLTLTPIITRTLAVLASLLLTTTAANAEEFITLASTTSTDQSGLFGFLLPKFETQSGIKVKVVALGTGQALDTGRRGDADVLLVHDRPAEDRFVAEGWGIERRDVMYNDFVMVGPKTDPAKIKGTSDAVEGFRRIAAASVDFVSRGDKSGTNAAELRFWKEAGVDPKTIKGYKEAGSGMGPTLNMSASLNAYTLADRGTWLSFKNRQDLEIVLAGDKRLFNPYGVMLVNPARHPHVKQEAGRKFIDWITSAEGQSTIAAYKINGEQLFFPDARK